MKKIRFIYLLFLAFLVASCAQILAPTGGEKDILPPKLIKINPENKSTNVSTKEFKFTFDEFFNIQNPSEKVLISPPLASKPDFKINGKSLIVTIADTLKENTTYSFVFSDCIKDITEGNTFLNYTYSFSTGNFIDSNIISGKVINAETLEPEKNVFVLLYKNTEDSLPLTTPPYYITKTNQNGIFSFGNISEGEYAIYALNDKNNNLIRDQYKEPFAFYHKPVNSYLQLNASEQKNITLRMFTQLDTVQRVIRTFVLSKGIQVIALKNPLENPNYGFLNESEYKNRFIFELNQSKDSLKIYDTKQTTDSIFILINDNNFNDTVFFITQQEVQKRFSKKGIEEKKYLSCRILNSDDLYKSTFLEFDYPIMELNQNTIPIIKNGKDTIFAKLKLNDSLKRRVIVEFEKEEKTKYTFLIADSIIKAYNFFVNDSLNHSFTVKSEAEYGSFIPKIRYSKQTPVIVQLADEKGIVLQEIKYQSANEVEFTHMKPATYRLFFLFDDNQNGHWDSGNYKIKQQVEIKVEYSKRISIKPNWDIEEEIDLDKLYDESIN